MQPGELRERFSIKSKTRLESIVCKQSIPTNTNPEFIIYYGNNFEYNVIYPCIKYQRKWTMKVDIKLKEDSKRLIKKPTEIIRYVKYFLNPPFRLPAKVVENEPFELTRFGYGTYSIGIEIVFKDKFNIEPLELTLYVCNTVEHFKVLHFLLMNSTKKSLFKHYLGE